MVTRKGSTVDDGSVYSSVRHNTSYMSKKLMSSNYHASTESHRVNNFDKSVNAFNPSNDAMNSHNNPMTASNFD